MSQGPQCLMSVNGERSNSAIFIRSRIRSSMSRRDMWQPKHPASEVVAMRTGRRLQRMRSFRLPHDATPRLGVDRLEIVAALADRHGVANALDQDRADRTDVGGFVRDRKVRVAEPAAR